MKWIMYSLTAISYILVVLGIMFSSETLDFKLISLGSLTLVYGAVLGFFHTLFEIK